MKKIEPDYYITKSKHKNKKYDIYHNGHFLLSFGDTRYEHYRDKTPLKLYSALDHKDKDRLINFWKRHKFTMNKNSANYWARYLW